MTSKFIALAALSLTVLTVSACTTRSALQDVPPGKYESTTKSTNTAGTNTSVQKTTNVGVDAYGNKTATVKTEKTTDPEGLFNKSKSTSTTTVK